MTTPTTEFADGTARKVQSVSAQPKAKSRAMARVLLRPRNLIILLFAALTAGAFFNWRWLVASGIAPIILAILPCGIMCALGMCMMPKRRCADDTGATGAETARRPLAPQPIPGTHDRNE